MPSLKSQKDPKVWEWDSISVHHQFRPRWDCEFLATVSSRTGLLQRAMSGFVALEPPGFDLMSVLTKSHVDDQGLVGHLGLC